MRSIRSPRRPASLLVLASLLALTNATEAPAETSHKMAPFGGGSTTPSPASAATPAPAGTSGAPKPSAVPAATPLASALDAFRSSDYPRAERELTAIRGTDHAQAQVAYARLLLTLGRYADADRIARAAGGDADLQNEALAIRARALFEQGKKAEAVALLEPAKDAPGPGGRAVRLLLGEYRIATGHRKDADDPLHAIIDDYNSDRITSTDAQGLAVAGRAAFLLRSPKDANKLLNESERVDPALVDGLRWHAELFLDTYDPGHAEETLNQARKVAPHRPDVAVMLAKVKLDQTLDFDAAEKLLEEALAVNPHLASAHAVRAGVALRDSELEKAASEVTAGLREDPNDTELLSLRAAERFLADDHAGFVSAKQEVFARNTEFARFYQILADFAEWEHRYEDIIAMMKEAVALDPDDGKAYAELGLTLMRDGDEQDGLEALRKAWSKDHFNVRVFNTLNLYEQTIATQYDLGQENVFNVRYPKDEEKVLARYVPKLLGEAWGSMKARYDFAPSSPVQVELYSNREQFSVRTSGLPNIGIEGVCFGHVVAAMSPKSEPFNWGNVLWHELGHVFAIQLSKSHVPRWFTEGLSEYETIVRRPEWRRELDPQLYQALVTGRLPGAVQMNRAFTHATDGEAMTVAYYASSQMLVFTAEQFGLPKVVRALVLWGEGKRTPEVFTRAFGVSPEEFDTRYRAWEKARLKRYDGQFMLDDRPLPVLEAKAKSEASPRDARLRAAYALSLLHERKGDEAKAAIDAALALDNREPTALYLSARLALAHKNAPDAAAKVEALLAAHVDGYAVQIVRAEAAEAKKDKATMRAAFEAAATFDPTQTEPLKGLFAIAEEEKRPSDAVDLLARWSLLDQHDRHVWTQLLGRLVEAKRWEEAAQAGESAVFVDVENAAVHLGYGRALAALGQHAKSAFEFESATVCNAPAKVRATASALLARERVATGDLAAAKSARDAALALDASNAEAKEVVIPEVSPEHGGPQHGAAGHGGL